MWVLLLTLVLAGCGFHLRGAGGGKPLAFKTLYLGVAEQSELGAALRRQILAVGGTALVARPSEAQAVLTVVAEGREKTILSLNAAGRVREFLLRQRFVFRVHDNQGHDFIPQSEVVVSRDISYSDSELLAKAAEEALLYRDMERDLVQQIMRRLAAAQMQEAESGKR
ncbi:MAG: LPS assembly lipoprotein LptE [Rhodocyclaceae bacterium]|nr:LPS assembly lipoprotein LptE [Rhodocyclaceae bacterium]